MKLSFSKGPLLAVLVVAALAAGTVLVAGYADQANQAENVSAGGKCSACPRAGTPECCKVTGVCAETQACAACTACEEKPQTASCPVAAAEGAAQACCPAEGVAQACCPATAAAVAPQACCGTDGCCTDAK